MKQFSHFTSRAKSRILSWVVLFASVLAPYGCHGPTQHREYEAPIENPSPLTLVDIINRSNIVVLATVQSSFLTEEQPQFGFPQGRVSALLGDVHVLLDRDALMRGRTLGKDLCVEYALAPLPGVTRCMNVKKGAQCIACVPQGSGGALLHPIHMLTGRDEEVNALAERIKALLAISESRTGEGVRECPGFLEWCVQCAEIPVTRLDGAQELCPSSQVLDGPFAKERVAEYQATAACLADRMSASQVERLSIALDACTMFTTSEACLGKILLRRGCVASSRRLTRFLDKENRASVSRASYDDLVAIIALSSGEQPCIDAAERVLSYLIAESPEFVRGIDDNELLTRERQFLDQCIK